MRNQRNNFIPLPTKPAKSTPKPLPKGLGTKRSSSSQTDRVVLIKEENLTFCPCSRIGHCDGGMRRDYIKAVNYINSCHKFINTVIAKNSIDRNGIFVLPEVPNFAPLFPYLIGKRPIKKDKKEQEEIKVNEGNKATKIEERKGKSNFGVIRKEEPTPLDQLPVGDCEKSVAQRMNQLNEDKYATQVADVVKEQIHQFLNTLQADMKEASKKKLETSQQKCKDLEICYLQKDIESNPQLIANLPQPPLPPSQNKDTSEDCSITLSDTECDEFKRRLVTNPQESTKMLHGSVSSLISESSDIKTDSDVEINITL